MISANSLRDELALYLYLYIYIYIYIHSMYMFMINFNIYIFLECMSAWRPAFLEQTSYFDLYF